MNKKLLNGRRLLRGGMTIDPPEVIEPDWSILRDFNSGAIGASASGTADGFDGDGTASVYTIEQVYSGARSCKMTITEGQGGFGAWGGIIGFGTELVKGDRLWYQHYYYMPESYILSTTPGWLKYLRSLTQTASNTHVGYLDCYINDDDAGIPDTTYRWIMEGQTEWVEYGPNRKFLRDQWVRQTVCVDFSDVPVGLGGTARVRHWENGVLLLDSAQQRTVYNNWLKTLIEPDHKATVHFLHTYWNNDNAPATQSSYVDDIRMAKNGLPSWVADIPGVNQ